MDESGDHSLSKIDVQYPLFGLTGVLVETSKHQEIAKSMSAWKKGFFGHDVCLHMKEITRNQGPFLILADAAVRARFWSELQAESDKHEFMLVCAVIKKNEHLAKYGPAANNPYYLTLKFLLERYCHEMRDRNSRAGFVAESRSRQLDNALKAQYTALMEKGTPYVSAQDFQQFFNAEIQFQGKQPEAAGLQIADLAVGPVTRYVGKMKRHQALMVRSRIRKGASGRISGYGLKSFPP